MIKNLTYLLFAFLILLSPDVISQEAESGGQAPADTTSANQSNADNTSSTSTSTDQQAAPPASSNEGAGGTASSGSAESTTDENAQPAEGASSEDTQASEALKASKEEKEKQEVKVEDVVQQEGGLISGKFELDVSESYSHTDNNQLYIDGFGLLPILVVGDVTVQNVRRDTLTTTITGNYKLTNKMQVSLSVPYQYTHAKTTEITGVAGKSALTPNTAKTAEAFDLGDISTSLSYQLRKATLGWPSITGGLGFKLRNGRDFFETPEPNIKPPPGSGFYTVRASLSFSKTTSPAVLFGSVSYGYGFQRNNILFTPKGKTATLIKSYKPGGSLGISGGFGLSINYDFSMNFSFAQTTNFASTLNGTQLASSEATSMTFNVGTIYRINNRNSVNVSLSQGLSKDAPSYTLTVMVPFRF